jgi:crotonobetainyl-CoA:carnitine CoA-transferase CaiB-like acyl-CoA transferase
VLDCTQGIAGPTAAMHLADLGADVLKVEPPEGDHSAAEPGCQCWNPNKQLTVLDLRDQQDVCELRRLGRRADVVVFDWPTARMERLGFDATSLRADGMASLANYAPYRWPGIGVAADLVDQSRGAALRRPAGPVPR